MAGTSDSRSSSDMELLQPQHSINIPTPQPNFPSTTYVSDREKYQAICLPLYEATLKGDWQAAQEIIARFPQVINMSITMYHDTVLHIASSTKHPHFVQELVKLMQPQDLELQNYHLNTALCVAAAAGTVDIAEIVVKKNPNLLTKRGANDMTPLSLAAFYRHNEMVSCLYSKANNMKGDEWTNMDRVMLMHACISAEFYDVALKLLYHHKKELALATDKNALHALARNPSLLDEAKQPLFRRLLGTILSGSRISYDEKTRQALEVVQIIWREVVKLEIDDMWNIIRGPSETGDQQPLFVAAALGNTKYLVELLRLSPELMWKKDDNGHTIFHVAVLHRQDSVYNLLYEIGSGKEVITSSRDSNNNSILHLAAMKPEQSRLHIVSGVALQMQREILWYKEVETVVHPSFREMKNKQGKTPQDLFTEEHTEMMEKGESWMKDTAAQCMVVAALVATIMFAAAFTLPGGTNGDNGHPIFKDRGAFIVFIITDAVSLFSSSASLLMFLAILTARYAESDFLVSLPMKLMIGLLTLFISIATMMIAFSASFFLVYTKGDKWVPYLICVLAGVPVVMFAELQYPLFYFVVRSTYNSKFLFKPTKHVLY